MSDDRLYFRQLLSGRDYAAHDPIAQQMVNFTYVIGDLQTRECVLVDPAYAVNELLDIVEADGMTVTGVLATHFHADHIGGNLMGHQLEGAATLLERCSCPVHVQRDETPWVMRTSGLGRDQLVEHDGGDRRRVAVRSLCDARHARVILPRHDPHAGHGDAATADDEPVAHHWPPSALSAPASATPASAPPSSAEGLSWQPPDSARA
ncbi:MAG: MBL fold metallo-hydrolase, partial [Ilumatobacteraceae bacterium]